MRVRDHSRRAQEKFADSLLTMSNFLFCGVLGSLLIVPMGALLRQMLMPETPQISVLSAVRNLPVGTSLTFLVVYVATICLGAYARQEGMRIYSRLHPDAH